MSFIDIDGLIFTGIGCVSLAVTFVSLCIQENIICPIWMLAVGEAILATAGLATFVRGDP